MSEELYRWWCPVCLKNKEEKPSYENSNFRHVTIEQMLVHDINTHGMTPPKGYLDKLRKDRNKRKTERKKRRK